LNWLVQCMTQSSLETINLLQKRFHPNRVLSPFPGLRPTSLSGLIPTEHASGSLFRVSPPEHPFTRGGG
jgi:hypothetical protein